MPAIMNFFARELGGVYVHVPAHVGKCELVDSLIHSVKEFGEFAGNLRERVRFAVDRRPTVQGVASDQRRFRSEDKPGLPRGTGCFPMNQQSTFGFRRKNSGQSENQQQCSKYCSFHGTTFTVNAEY